MKKHVRRSSLSAGGILKLSRSIGWALLAIIALQAPGSAIAMKQEQPLSQRKQNILRRLVANYKETRELYRKRKAGKASPQELEKLEERMKSIRKTAIRAGIIAAFIAALFVGRWGYGKYRAAQEAKAKEEEEERRQQELKEKTELGIEGRELETVRRDWMADLIEAVRNNEVDAVRLLLERKKVDPNAAYGEEKTTALAEAIIKHNIPIINLLLAHGADPNKGNWGKAPLHLAIRTGQLDVTRLLLEKRAKPDEKDQSGFTPLHWAAMQDEIAIAQLLLARDANVNARDNKGETPLHLAAHQGRHAIAKLLIKNKANVDEKDQSGFTPLHWAAMQDETAIAQLLLARDANVNAKNNEGYTPLHLATHHGRPKVAQLLLARDANVNAKNNKGETPLHSAASEIPWTPAGHKLQKEIVQLLLGTPGIKVNTKDNAGRTPFDVASLRIKNLIQGEMGFREAVSRRALREAFTEHGAEILELEEMILQGPFPEEAARRTEMRRATVKAEEERKEKLRAAIALPLPDDDEL